MCSNMLANLIKVLFISSLCFLKCVVGQHYESALTSADKLNKILSKLEVLEKKTSGLQKKLDDTEKLIFHRGCKEYVGNNRYNYNDTLSLDDETLRYVTVRKDENGEITFLEMHVAIKSPNHGYILLSPVFNPGPNDFVFEIAVGVTFNFKTALRVKINGEEIASVFTSGVLSASHYVAFYIRLHAGLLQFGLEGKPDPIFKQVDSRVGPIKYFGFTSSFPWNSNKAEFLYDCPPYIMDKIIK